MVRCPADAAACKAVAPPPAATLGSAEDCSRCLTAYMHDTRDVTRTITGDGTSREGIVQHSILVATVGMHVRHLP